MNQPNRFAKRAFAFFVTALAAGVFPAAAIAEEAAAEPTEIAAVAQSDPAETVGELHTTLLEAMKGAEELGYQGRYDLLVPALHETFDLDFMASKAVGRGWKKLDEQQQAQWKDAFGRLITANFAGRFEGYSGQHFETIGKEAAAHDTIMVLAKIVDPGNEDIAINYRMQEKDDDWKIVDVYFNGTVSELAMRRSEYSSLLKREGFDGLLTAVDARIAEFASGKVEE